MAYPERKRTAHIRGGPMKPDSMLKDAFVQPVKMDDKKPKKLSALSKKIAMASSPKLKRIASNFKKRKPKAVMA